MESVKSGQGRRKKSVGEAAQRVGRGSGSCCLKPGGRATGETVLSAARVCASRAVVVNTWQAVAVAVSEGSWPSAGRPAAWLHAGTTRAMSCVGLLLADRVHHSRVARDVIFIFVLSHIAQKVVGELAGAIGITCRSSCNSPRLIDRLP
jgi:hypothetical protein